MLNHFPTLMAEAWKATARSALIRTALAASLTLAAPIGVSRQVAAQDGNPKRHPMTHVHTSTQEIQIPAAMRAEHEEIHGALERATQEPGRVGEAARALAKVLHPHFVREEQIALPPLGLLAPLARGEYTPDMREVLPMTDSLRAELPRMLQEHVAIRAATMKLGEVARAEQNATVARLAEQLAHHARSEEELFYPAAILVGDLVRAKEGARTE